LGLVDVRRKKKKNIKKPSIGKKKQDRYAQHCGKTYRKEEGEKLQLKKKRKRK